jgi:hypothetical protein
MMLLLAGLHVIRDTLWFLSIPPMNEWFHPPTVGEVKPVSSTDSGLFSEIWNSTYNIFARLVTVLYIMY